MKTFIKDIGRSMEILLFLVIGYFLTVNIASNLYEIKGAHLLEMYG
ncbi:hypothetical protein [Alkalihalobacillus sp. LMS39]|nr:hypothetical protein [Alkalihalobacillus sp. LMS39]UOE94710.1 hypothetical protein MM271_03420 [Alkalihalobacillus sp. LMS39]